MLRVYLEQQDIEDQLERLGQQDTLDLKALLEWLEILERLELLQTYRPTVSH